MTDFNSLKSQWQGQEDVAPKAEDYQEITSKLKDLKYKQNITVAVLLSTLLILIFFFVYVSAFDNALMTLGLSLMIGSLLLRVGVEYESIRKLKAIETFLEVNSFKSKLVAYYKRRKKTHYVIAPIIVLTYSIGFVIMLPLFKANLSKGFYLYIVISSILIFLVLGGYIIKQIKQELKELKALQQME